MHPHPKLLTFRGLDDNERVGVSSAEERPVGRSGDAAPQRRHDVIGIDGGSDAGRDGIVAGRRRTWLTRRNRKLNREVHDNTSGTENGRRQL